MKRRGEEKNWRRGRQRGRIWHRWRATQISSVILSKLRRDVASRLRRRWKPPFPIRENFSGDFLLPVRVPAWDVFQLTRARRVFVVRMFARLSKPKDKWNIRLIQEIRRGERIVRSRGVHDFYEQRRLGILLDTCWGFFFILISKVPQNLRRKWRICRDNPIKSVLKFGLVK